MGAANMGFISILGARLYYLQVSESDKYKTLAEGNRIRVFPTIPRRGRIFDRYGNVLAEGKKRYQLVFDPYIMDSDQRIEVVDRVATIVGLDINGKKALMSRLYEQKKKGNIILIGDVVSWEDVAKIEVNASDLPGVTISSPEARYYPYGELTSHLIGYVGGLSQKDIEKGDLYGPLYQHPDYKIGKTGLEKSLQDRLFGEAGMVSTEVDALGVQVRELADDNGVAGEDISLTIDVELQEFVANELKGKGGLDEEGASAVVMDVTNGDILAMTSVPSYDSNSFVRGIGQDYWQKLITSLDSPLTNKAVSSLYPPGSTFKLVTALAALEEGVITKHTKHYCPGYYEFGNRRFHCWERRGHGHLDVHHAISKSCNVFFYKIATKIGIDKLADLAFQFGLGEISGLDLIGEKAGIIPSKDWKRAEIGEPWYAGETLNASIGQGYSLTTPLQLAVMTARFASGGKFVTPRLVLEEDSKMFDVVGIDSGEKIMLPSRKRTFGDLEVSKENVKIVLEGMGLVANDPGGTVYPYRIKQPEYEMAGKTGTAQVVGKTFKYTPKKKAERYHALFVGFAPTHSPKYAVSVVVEHGGYGSTVAAPIGSKILKKLQEMENLKS